MSEVLVNAIEPISIKTNELLKDQVHLDKILSIGASKAREIASKTISKLYDKIGIINK